MPEVSILLLTKNGRPDLEGVLTALFAQRFAGNFEVVAVDSGSTDGTLELLQRFPIHLTRIPPDEFHHARTRNFAAGLATSQILVFLSQDAIPASDKWLQSLVSNFDDPTVGAVYGRQIPVPGSSLERQDALDAVYGDRKLIKDPAHVTGWDIAFITFLMSMLRYAAPYGKHKASLKI